MGGSVMKHHYTSRIHEFLGAGTRVEHPPEMPELVHLDDPAISVFTDFNYNRPPLVSPEVSIDAALNKMKLLAVRLLLVVDDDGIVIGQIMARDIMGDAPVRLAKANGRSHNEMTVAMLMTPRQDIKVVDWSHVKDAKIGHIVATMHELECYHLPVTENGRVRGIFSVMDISRHLGFDVSENTMCAHSLAEIVHTLG
jgi:CBS domain-containing protein